MAGAASPGPARLGHGAVFRDSALPREADVAIVGGGTTGLFTALFLARSGREVVVLDRSVPWSEASGVNAGSLAVQNKLLSAVPYTLEALRLWAGMAELLGADVGFRNGGGYRVALTEEEREILFGSADDQARFGVVHRRLVGAELREAAPWIAEDVVAATYSTQDSYANPLLLGPALLRACARMGVTIHPNVEIREIETGAGVTLHTGAGALHCQTAVIASGAWTTRLAASVGMHLPIQVETNMLTVTEPAPETVPHILTDTRGVLTVKQVANGTCLIGGGWQGSGDHMQGRKDIDYESLLHNLRLAVRTIPGLRKLNIVRCWAGFDGMTPDNLPYFGRLSQTAPLYVSACARGGFTLGPLLGRMMAELVTTGETSMPIDAFAPGRFSHA